MKKVGSTRGELVFDGRKVAISGGEGMASGCSGVDVAHSGSFEMSR